MTALAPTLDAPAVPTPTDVVNAAARLSSQLVTTPFVRADRLSAMLNVDLWLKLETLQATGSFKERGALNALLCLSQAEREAGVIAVSAGNHAQGLAYHGARLGVPVTLVMPETTPDNKVERTRAFGAEIILYGADFQAARAHMESIKQERDLTLIHPFDDPRVIAGQGTLGLEMLRQNPELDVIVSPVGGGGLLAGLALAAESAASCVRIIGVQTRLYPSMKRALFTGPDNQPGATLAEGIAVDTSGPLASTLCEGRVEDICLVDEPAIERAMSYLMFEQKLVVEGAAAAGLAAILDQTDQFAGNRVGLVITGGNIDQRLLSMILMRDLARTGRLARLRIELLDTPGALHAVSGLIAAERGNVIDVAHHRTYSDLPAKLTCMEVTLDTLGQSHLERIMERLRAHGYAVDLKQD